MEINIKEKYGYYNKNLRRKSFFLYNSLTVRLIVLSLVTCFNLYGKFANVNLSLHSDSARRPISLIVLSVVTCFNIYGQLATANSTLHGGSAERRGKRATSGDQNWQYHTFAFGVTDESDVVTQLVSCFCIEFFSKLN